MPRQPRAAAGYPALLTALVFVSALNYPLVSVTVRHVPPAAAASGRLLIAGAVSGMFALCLVHEAVPLIRSSWRSLLLLGLGYAAVPYLLVAWGQQRIGAGTASVIHATTPLFVVAFVLMLDRRRRITAAQAAGLVLALGGVAIVVGAQPTGTAQAVAGGLALLASAAVFALTSVLVEFRLAALPPLLLMAATSSLGGLMLLPVALAEVPIPPVGTQSAAALLLSGLVATPLSQLLIFTIVRRHGAARFSLANYLTPVVAVLAGVVLLGEPLTVGIAGGILMVIVGVLAAGRAGSLSRPTEPLPAADAAHATASPAGMR